MKNGRLGKRAANAGEYGCPHDGGARLDTEGRPYEHETLNDLSTNPDAKAPI